MIALRIAHTCNASFRWGPPGIHPTTCTPAPMTSQVPTSFPIRMTRHWKESPSIISIRSFKLKINSYDHQIRMISGPTMIHSKTIPSRISRLVVVPDEPIMGVWDNIQVTITTQKQDAQTCDLIVHLLTNPNSMQFQLLLFLTIASTLFQLKYNCTNLRI